jgi:hypothetical protein
MRVQLALQALEMCLCAFDRVQRPLPNDLLDAPLAVVLCQQQIVHAPPGNDLNTGNLLLHLQDLYLLGGIGLGEPLLCQYIFCEINCLVKSHSAALKLACFAFVIAVFIQFPAKAALEFQRVPFIKTLKIVKASLVHRKAVYRLCKCTQ